jgi:hypothetical protein
MHHWENMTLKDNQYTVPECKTENWAALRIYVCAYVLDASALLPIKRTDNPLQA